MNYPEYVEVNGKLYKINTDFRVAIECNAIAQDDNISNIERSLAIIYKLYGDEGLDNSKDYAKLLELGQKYLLCNEEKKESNKDPDFDFIDDFDYIEASFMSDFHIDLQKEDMHWWKFVKLINGLSNSEFGNCCILNNVRNIRNYDISKIKDPKEKQKIKEAKEAVALKKKPKVATKEQLKSAAEFYNKLKI